MKKAIAFAAIVAVAIVVGAAAGLALSAEKEDELFDLLMSDMPLKVVKNVAEVEEWQANDTGTVLILLVPYCDGTAI